MQQHKKECHWGEKLHNTQRTAQIGAVQRQSQLFVPALLGTMKLAVICAVLSQQIVSIVLEKTHVSK